MITNGSDSYIESLHTSNLAFGSGTGILEITSGTVGVIPAGATNQILTTTATDVSWQNPVVQSVFGRTGAVTASSGDYSIAQITSASVLADSANISIAGATSGDYLSYNGALWAKKTPYFYTNAVSNAGVNFTAVLNTIYVCPNCTITMPTTTLSDIGKRILISTNNGNDVYITFPLGITLTNSGSSNFTIHSSYGAIELIVVSNNVYSIVSCSSNLFTNSVTGKSFAPQNLNDLGDISTASLFNGDIIKYNSTSQIWQNTRLFQRIYLASNTSLTDWNALQQNGQTATYFNAYFPMATVGGVYKLYITLSAAPTAGNGRTFTIYINGTTTGQILTIADTATSGTLTTLVSYNAGDSVLIMHNISGAPAAASAVGFFEYANY